MCKVINRCSPTTMSNFFLFRENTQNVKDFQIMLDKKKVVGYGLETVSYSTSLFWVERNTILAIL